MDTFVSKGLEYEVDGGQEDPVAREREMSADANQEGWSYDKDRRAEEPYHRVRGEKAHKLPSKQALKHKAQQGPDTQVLEWLGQRGLKWLEQECQQWDRVAVEDGAAYL